MANEEIKEQISLEAELNKLFEEKDRTVKRGNTTIADRVSLMEDAVKYANNNKQLQIIQNDLSKKATEFAKAGNKQLAKKYLSNAQSVMKQIQSNKIEEENKKIQEKLTKEREKQYKAVTDMSQSMLTIFGLGGGILAVFSKFNKMTATIGKNFGALGMTNKEFKKDMLEAGAAATSLGQNIEDVAGIQKDLTDNFGFGRDESVAMAEGIMDTSMALGLSNQEGTKLVGSLMQISGLSFDAAQNFSKQTALLAEAEGVSPTTVMRDIANSSETIAKFTAMTPEHLMKAAIQATKLGTTLDTIAGSMESMLDFQSSLNAEIEAQIMLGRDVNLTKARDLALAGKADEFAVELTKQVGSQAEFEKLNVLQRQSLAKALGVSVEQMGKMVRNQDKVRTIGEAIAEQDGLEKMIGREAMDNMAKIVADMQRIGAQLVIDIGPTIASVAGGIAKFTKGLSESKALLPTLVGFMTIMAAKSMVSAYTSLITAAALSGIGPGALAAGLLIATTGAGLITAGVQSFQDLPDGQIASLEKGKAIFDPGETVVHTQNLRDMSRETEKKLDKTNEKLDALVTAVERNAGRVGTAIGDMA